MLVRREWETNEWDEWETNEKQIKVQVGAQNNLVACKNHEKIGVQLYTGVCSDWFNDLPFFRSLSHSVY